MNNARPTLNVRAKNSQFPSIVSLAFAACFMHFIISGGASEERIGEERRGEEWRRPGSYGERLFLREVPF